MASKMSLADILISSGVINEEQKEKALKTCAQVKCQFSEAVIKLGFANEDAIAVALAKMLGLPYASRENKILKVEKGQGLEKNVSETFARENLVLPLFLDESVLAVAVADPENVMMLENLKLMTQCEIQPFVATKSQILKVIDEFYTGGGTTLIEKTMEKATPPPRSTMGDQRQRRAPGPGQGRLRGPGRAGRQSGQCHPQAGRRGALLGHPP